MCDKYKHYYDMKTRKESYKPLPSYDLSGLKIVGVVSYALVGCTTFVMLSMYFISIGAKITGAV